MLPQTLKSMLPQTLKSMSQQNIARHRISSNITYLTKIYFTKILNQVFVNFFYNVPDVCTNILEQILSKKSLVIFVTKSNVH